MWVFIFLWITFCAVYVVKTSKARHWADRDGIGNEERLTGRDLTQTNGQKTWNDGFGDTFGESSSKPGSDSSIFTGASKSASNSEHRNYRSPHRSHSHSHGYHYRSKASTVIVDENKKHGTRDWLTPQPIESPLIEGFASSFSHYPGDIVNFKLNCSALPMHFKHHEVRVYRLGYYNETGGRLVAKLSVDNNQCRSQPACSFYDPDRLVSCKNWEVNARWKVPVDIPTGVFVALPMVLSIEAGTSSSAGSDQKSLSQEQPHLTGGHIPFVVKEAKSRKHASEILFKTSDLTWVAYNKFGGYNLYHNTTSKDFSGRAFRASYDRPFLNRLIYPLGFSQNFLFNSEYPMLYWLEKHGYDISYASCADIEVLHEEQRLFDHRVLLSVGHDEYWTPSMRKAYSDARDHGVHLGFFSSNTMFWRTIWEDNYHPELKFDMESVFPGFMSKIRKQKDQFRVMVCRKETLDLVPITTQTHSMTSSSSVEKIRDDLWTGTFDDPRSRSLPEPTSSLTGQVFAANAYQNASMTIGRDDSILRIWRNTSIVSSYRRHTLLSSMGESNSQELNKAGGNGTWTYTTPAGILGYELDSYREDMFNPPGLISYSTTKLYIKDALVENYGASYRGSGWIDHRITMYRYYIDKIRYRPHDHLEDLTQAKQEMCKSIDQTLTDASMRRNPLQHGHSHQHQDHIRTSLVFSTGTMQWSWALSSLRDGDPMDEDFNIHQATLNILADMYVLPYSFRGKVSIQSGTEENERSQPRVLSIPTAPTDRLAPVSKIHSSHGISQQSSQQHHNGHGPRSGVNVISLHQTKRFSISGSAVDLGGGRVAAVEVSLDGGRTWHLATGRYNWYYNHYFDVPVETFNETRRFNESYHYPSMDSTTVINLRDALIQEGLLYSENHHHIQHHSNDSFTVTHRKSHRHSSTAHRHKRHQQNGVEVTASGTTGNSLHLHMLVISRAVDDSGWIEEYDSRLETVLCDLANFSGSNRHGGVESIASMTNHLATNMAYFSLVL